MELSHAFTIFFLTMGPLKVMPAFYMATLEMNRSTLRRLTILGAMFALIIILSVAFIANYFAHSWRISLPSFTLSGGIILFITSFNAFDKFTLKNPEIPGEEVQEINPNVLRIKAISPVAIPIIISPVGVVAVMSAMLLSKEDLHLQMSVFGLLALIMGLNLIGMWFSRTIVKLVGMPVFSVIGWVFSIIQAGLGVQFVVNSLSKLYP